MRYMFGIALVDKSNRVSVLFNSNFITIRFLAKNYFITHTFFCAKKYLVQTKIQRKLVKLRLRPETKNQIINRYSF